MLTLLVSAGVIWAGLQAGIDGPRKAFAQCLHDSAERALSQKIPADGFKAFIEGQCGVQIEALQNGMAAFDAKHGVKLAKAKADARAMIDDDVAMAGDNYAFKIGKQ